MPKRIVRQSIVLHRDGKPVRPEIGKLFDFTAEELEDLKHSPGSVDKLVKQDGSAETPEEEAAREAKEAQEQTDAKKKAEAAKTTGANKGAGKPADNDL